MGAKKKRVNVSSTVEQKPVIIDVDECRGCMLCQQACPFEALAILVDESGGEQQMHIDVALDGDRCAECGFCVNACEFGAVSMGGWNKNTFQLYIEDLLQGSLSREKATTIAFVCERSFAQEGFYNEDNTRFKSNDNVATMIIPCIGVISQSQIDNSLGAGANRVIVIGCRELDCHYRETRRRLKLDSERYKGVFFVDTLDQSNVSVMRISPFETKQLFVNIDKFHNQLETGQKVN